MTYLQSIGLIGVIRGLPGQRMGPADEIGKEIISSALSGEFAAGNAPGYCSTSIIGSGT
jgi:hypothetical protein